MSVDPLAVTQFNTISSLDGMDQIVGYDAVKDVGRRRATRRRVYIQDRKLRDNVRERAIATAQDLQQNFVAAAWAIRKHLDYVSTLVFQADTGNDELNNSIEQFMGDWGKRLNLDVSKRHNLRRFIRLAEMRRVVDGDFFIVRLGGRNLATRGKLQAIEGYRVQQPNQEQIDMTGWINGVEVDKFGASRRYSIYHRDPTTGNKAFTGYLNARNVSSIGYFDRFDQIRGISPLMAGINAFQDVYEGIDMALAKMKVSQLFGLVLTRDAMTAEDQMGGPVPTVDSDDDGQADAGYEFDFGSGPQFLDLDEGHDAKFIESGTPATETVDFMRFCVSMALKSLDLPDSFLQEDKTNFFGSRAALIHYQRSCESKIADLTEMLDEITAWRVGMAIADGTIPLPAGMTWDDVSWVWKHRGLPWWDPLKEASGNIEAIKAGFDNYENVTHSNGTWIEDNIRINAKWEKLAEETQGRSLAPAMNMPGQIDSAEEESVDEESADEEQVEEEVDAQ